MQKTDLALGALAVAAVLVTAIGVAASDCWSGEHTVRFGATSTPLASQGPADAGGAGARFNWTVPDNATSAQLQVAVAFSGQAAQGGSATVTVRVQAPDGRFAQDTVRALAIPQGATQAAIDVPLNVTWAQVPRDVRDAKGAAPAGIHWEHPLSVLVSVSRPSDLPVATYGFTASAAGTVHGYVADPSSL